MATMVTLGEVGIQDTMTEMPVIKMSNARMDGYKHLRQAAVSFLQFHEHEANTWKSQLTRAETFLNSFKTGKTKTTPVITATPVETTVEPTQGSTVGLTLRDAVYLVLGASQQPMSTAEMAEAIYAGGFRKEQGRTSVRDIYRSLPGVIAHAVRGVNPRMFKFQEGVYAIVTRE